MMPLYEYTCPACGKLTDSLQRVDRMMCSWCGAIARRRYSFNRQPSGFTGHFNVAAGRYVNSEGDLRSAFAKASEDQSNYTGMNVDIQPVDLRDREACGITDSDIDKLKADGSMT